MSVLSTVEAVPNRLAIIYEFLVRAGENGESFERLLALLSPRDRNSDLTKAVLREFRKLELAEIVDRPDGSRVVLREMPNHTEIASLGLEQVFRMQVESHLLSPEFCTLAGQEGFALALAWLLSQNPARPVRKSDRPIELLQTQLENLELEISNTAAYQNLLYWARYLGFASWVGLPPNGSDFVVPDPTEAIRRRLDTVFAGRGQLAISGFINAMAKYYPVLEEGEIRMRLEGHLKPGFRREPGRLSKATSLALRRLELRGLIRLSCPSDASALLLDFGQKLERCSHIDQMREGQ